MYLDAWVAEKINMGKFSGVKTGNGYRHGNGPFDFELLTREALDAYNQTKRVELLAFLLEKSPFYQKHLAGFKPFLNDAMSNPMGLYIDSTLDNKWAEVPFTSANDLIREGKQMLCVHPGEISRIVTQTTSGTTGPSKRIYFTPEDQELTIDYFHYGMKIMVTPGDKVLILLPHMSPGSLGFLLQEGLSRLGAQGFFKDSLEAEASESQYDFESLAAIVGPPSLILGMAKTHPDICPSSVLMTADFVAADDRKAVKDAWGSRVFEHYGMTEMGLGCAMSCRDTDDNPPVGYHIRENDLYIEIIDPVSKKNLPDGEWGEIVMTTLTRRGMPFLRYRTGDTGRLLKDSCSCGSVLKRLDRVQKRTEIKNINE